ncbi:hypothetical protein [Thiomicrorhabdus arctica]|jgi:hypothetical protein|uniref:hypothetical protein n=1 Tax=Thiomicrorhabdus arctica TaxID=131540 RepID=UPI0003711C4D|nr:hypothetical protein [Thiomicrorhabdus arctica]
MKKIVLLIVLLLAWRHFYYIPDAPKMGPGAFASGSPSQENISIDPFRFNGYTLTPRASFDVIAKVISVERYYFDYEARVSPVDFVLGWGPMSDESILEQIDISQDGRWYKWTSDSMPITKEEIMQNSSNMHMIPENDAIAEALKRVRNGDLVSISGILVDVKSGSSWKWKTSTSRSDTGSTGEIVFIKSIKRIDPVY